MIIESLISLTFLPALLVSNPRTLAGFLAVGDSPSSDKPLIFYRGVLHSPGGELPFILQFSLDPKNRRAWIVNGKERIEVDSFLLTKEKLILDMKHYDSKIEAISTGTSLRSSSSIASNTYKGVWKKRAGQDKWSQLDFTAEPARGFRFTPLHSPAKTTDSSTPVSGRWSVRFSKSDEAAIGTFTQSPGNVVEGTFLTVTGDYRFLAGSYEVGRLRLSNFDGAHAFLFDARLQPDGRLTGDFWSRDAWHETWTGVRDRDAKLPDGFTLTTATGRMGIKDLRFPDLGGKLRSLADPSFDGKARIIEVFGSWCPNCNDASAYLVELDRRYRSRGLSILGLAFELTGDFERDSKQVRRFVQRHGIKYPVLIAGLSDKKKASLALPILDRVRAYPTTLFLSSDGTIRAVHTGFSGPATGEANQLLRKRFESTIEQLLDEEK